MMPLMAVIIATKNRAEAIEKYALPSLVRSEFRDFVCIVWDASDDMSTQEIVGREDWSFNIRYVKAPRVGLTSQRNDAVRYVLETFPGIRYVVFMDDDCELSPDALSGALATFRKHPNAAIVNIPMKSLMLPSFSFRFRNFVKHCLGMSRHGATAFLYNYGAENETPGGDIEWASGGGMMVDVSVFRDLHIIFPEAFQRFGGYALGEDFAFSFFVYKKLCKRICNSLYGHFVHHAAGSARLNVMNMAASKWYNFHLLFDVIYDDVAGIRFLRLKIQFKLFMWAAALKLLVRARSFDIMSVLRGIKAARIALREFHETQDIKMLMRDSNSHGTEALQK